MVDQKLVSLVCRSCGGRQTRTLNEIVALLRGQGRLRRDASPSWEAIQQLWALESACWACLTCDETGLALETWSQLEEWEDSLRKCDVCGKAIDADRLEVFPDAVCCTACQRNNEANPSGYGVAEYCPRCGSQLSIIASRGTGAYQERCDQCGFRSR